MALLSRYLPPVFAPCRQGAGSPFNYVGTFVDKLEESHRIGDLTEISQLTKQIENRIQELEGKGEA